jgi:hypothetical protein
VLHAVKVSKERFKRAVCGRAEPRPFYSTKVTEIERSRGLLQKATET